MLVVAIWREEKERERKRRERERRRREREGIITLPCFTSTLIVTRSDRCQDETKIFLNVTHFDLLNFGHKSLLFAAYNRDHLWLPAVRYKKKEVKHS